MEFEIYSFRAAGNYLVKFFHMSVFQMQIQATRFCEWLSSGMLIQVIWNSVIIVLGNNKILVEQLCFKNILTPMWYKLPLKLFSKEYLLHCFQDISLQ